MIRRTPLKRSTKPIKRISTKQREKNAEWKEIKTQVLQEMLDEYGFCFCMECKRVFAVTLEAALERIDGDHIIKRSLGGKNTRENCNLLCRRCHVERHS